MNLLSSFSIRAKLLLAFLSVLLLSALLIFFGIRSINTITALKSTNEKLETLELNLAIQELAAKEFIYEGYKTQSFQKDGSSPQIDHFEKSQANTREILAFLSQHANEYDESWEKLKAIQLDIAAEFDSLRNLLKTRGFKDFGLEGSLRKAVHAVESRNSKYDKALLLTLRRNEKDFFLRRDEKYQADFSKNIILFMAGILKADPEAIPLIETYEQEFNRVVALEKVIGLTEDMGIRGHLKNNLATYKPLLIEIKGQVLKANEEEMSRTFSTLIFVFVLQLILGITLAVTYSNAISKSIKGIRNAMTTLAAGSFPEKLKVDSTEEIGQTKTALNQLVDRVQSAVEFSTMIGQGQLATQYNNVFQEDVLAQALIQMQKQIKEADERQYRSSWVNEGLAAIGEITKDERKSLKELGDALLSTLVKYVGANQSILYVIENTTLLSIASHAVSNIKRAEIEIGTGLVGQCAQDGEMINLAQVPAGYRKITSGLGESQPSHLVLIPLKLDRKTYGVLEMASLNSLEEYKIAFLEKASETIALLIFNRKSSESTEKLLAEAKQKAETLQQQEEEMRQNMEELTAVQEQLKRRTEETEARVNLLDDAGIGAAEFDANGTLTEANASLLSILQFSKEELVGMRYRSFARHDALQENDDKLFEKMFRNDHTIILDQELFVKAGQRISVRSAYSCTKSHGGQIQKIVALFVPKLSVQRNELVLQ